MKQSNIIAVAGLGTRHSLGMDIGIITPLKRFQGEGKPIDYMRFIPYSLLDNSLGQMIMSWKDDTYFLCHSYGVRSVMQMLRRWENKGPRVPAIISFDPSQYVWPGQNDVPDRAEAVHNFYQKPPWWRPFGIGGQKLKRIGGGTHGIVNEEVDASHTGIDNLVYTQTKSMHMLKIKLRIME